jgi:cytochrome P450
MACSMAGSDTTATALRATTLFIITQPKVYAALQSEIDKAEQSNRLSKPIIEDVEAKNLPYLQACIKEGLRIWPPVMGLNQKTVPPGGEMVNGKFIPGGVNIGYCAWGVQRNNEVFGEDAHIFRPERWLGVNEERLSEMHRVADLVFGHGRYGCLGKPVALLELGKALAEVCKASFHPPSIADRASVLDLPPL